MTEKRFNFVGGYLYDGNKPIGHVEDITFRQDFEDIVNALHEENQSLKQSFDLINKVRKELIEENEQLQFENNELKCALALNEVDYIIADGKKIDMPPYYEVEQRYDSIMHRREYDGYD